MTKDQATAIFGSQAAIARALGLSRAAISLWCKDGVLSEARTDRVIGAAIRLGKPIPKDLVPRVIRPTVN